MTPLIVGWFVAGAVTLALCSVLFRRRDPDGVRALDIPDPESAKPFRHTATICNTSYIDRSILLGDTDYKYCQFIRCRLIVDGPFSMEACFMESCTLQSANVVKAQAINELSGERRPKNRYIRKVPLTTPTQED